MIDTFLSYVESVSSHYFDSSRTFVSGHLCKIEHGKLFRETSRVF